MRTYGQAPPIQAETMTIRTSDLVPAPTPPKIALEEYRDSDQEQERLRSLFQLIPGQGRSALDIGARDGYLSLRLAERFASVTALDLELPRIDHPSVACVRGDVRAMEFPRGTFELVLCAEVLEHLPPVLLPEACAEISRVARDKVLIGVPYRQDIRSGRTTCGRCRGKNPPWGHVNVFDKETLQRLFPDLRIEAIEYSGQTRDRTNFISAWLLDRAGNPWGSYNQEEPCIHCGARMLAPASRGLAQKLLSFVGQRLKDFQGRFLAPRPIWIHVLFSKPQA